MAEWLRRVSVWEQDGTSQVVAPTELAEADGFRWFELTCGGEQAGAVLKAIGEHCPGLTEPMLQDLLTPDERPQGERYDGGIQLASSFSVIAWRPKQQSERGKPQGVGVLRFQPVELLAGNSWLITCWHPERIFQGSRRVDEGLPPGGAVETQSWPVAW